MYIISIKRERLFQVPLLTTRIFNYIITIISLI